MAIKTYPISFGTMLKNGNANLLFATDDEATEYAKESENEFSEVLQECLEKQ